MYKLAFVATSYIKEYDGVSVYLENLMYELLRQPLYQKRLLMIDLYLHEAVVDLFSERILEGVDAENVHLIALPQQGAAAKFADLQRRILGKRYDLVFVPNPMPLFFSRGRRLKVIHDLTIKQTPELFSGAKHRYIDFLIGYMKRFDDKVGYISRQTKEDIRHFYGIADAKLLYLPNGIPFKVRQLPRPEQEDAFAKYAGDALELVVVGRINRSKGFDRVLQLLAYLEALPDGARTFERVILHVAGKQTDETKKILEGQHFTRIALHFYGYVSDEELNNLYEKSHFCLFLSRNEGYGLPLVEAMWLRTVPVISDIPVFGEILGEAYPKFSDRSGYGEAIYSFMRRIFGDETYRRDIFAMIERSVAKESRGYALCAENLLGYLTEGKAS
ncbi:MAG: hypothetical protein DSZ05_04240 [Sulfurospirillum sp.]|nr:MAG: hypothetical protein DSZ05_04240 [Sulfurospirillum sp.]